MEEGCSPQRIVPVVVNEVVVISVVAVVVEV